MAKPKTKPRKTNPPIKPDPPIRKHARSINALMKANIALTAENVKLQAELAKRDAKDAAQWMPLKTAALDAGIPYETARTWADKKLIEADRFGGRVIVNQTSLMARLFRLGRRK